MEYKHQQQALTAACHDGESLLVATGTGSGKTETFLYPIAHQLLSDPHPDTVGVRCLLVYPMNALANDQLYYRIAPLFGCYLAENAITFGRFTSQTPKDRRDEEESKLHDNSKLMAAIGDKIPENWLLTREEMLDKPPKILVTNYAMLEHLLLLPRNAPLFAQNCLQTIVLDEIHTYTGAQATEVAFLLRKLKNRLGLEKSLQVFGTSASFPAGEHNDTQILNFASDLFGEKVHRVVRGKREVHRDLTGDIDNSFSLPIATWMLLSEGLRAYSDEELFDHDVWQEMLETQDLHDKLPPLNSHLDFPLALQKVFAQNREIRSTAKLLDTQGIQPFASVAKKVFADHPDAKRADLSIALSGVIHVGMLARQNDNSFPLLPGRYHLAANSIEGICVRLDVTNEGWQDFKLLRQYQTDEAIYYPLLTCRKCGQPYIEAFEHRSKLHNRRPLAANSQSRRVFWLGTPPDIHTIDEDDEDAETQQSHYQKISANPKTGHLDADGEVVLYSVETREDKEEKRTYVHRCPACGGTPGNIDAEIVTRFHPGNEALASVVTQKVLETLPPNLEQDEPVPFAGRSLLTFSDNRQNAAFFAPYFERTGGDVALRTAIYQVLNEADEPMELELLGRQIYKFWRKLGQPVLLGDKGKILSSWEEMQDYLLGYVAAEFLLPGGDVIRWKPWVWLV